MIRMNAKLIIIGLIFVILVSSAFAQQKPRLKPLRGKVVGGYTANATVNVVWMELLRKKGLKTDDYKILNIGTARFG